MVQRLVIRSILPMQRVSVSRINMVSKSYTRATSCLIFLLVVGHACGQSPAPTQKFGYIRFWDMLPPANGSFEVRKAAAPSSEGPLFNGRAYQYMSYTELPVGKYQLAVAKKGDTAPLKIFNVDVKPDSFFTILLSPHSGVMAAE